MSFYGKWETWKEVCIPKNSVTDDRAHAMYSFRQQHEGKYHTVESITQVSF